MDIRRMTQRQFDKTLEREGKDVVDYFSGETYRVFFRNDNRGTNPQGKLRFYYPYDSKVKIGTVFSFKGQNWLVVSQDAIESDIYLTSMAMKCSTTFRVKDENKQFHDVPFVVASDKYGVDFGKTLNVINGSVMIYTGLNDYAKCMKVDDLYKNFGGVYKVSNFFYNDNLAYIYLARDVEHVDEYKLVYNGTSILDINDATYQLSFTATINDEIDPTATLTYVSSDESIATVDETGLLTMVSDGTVTVTATWTEQNVTCKANITITGEIVVVKGTSAITGSSTIKIGYSAKTYIAHFYNANGEEVSGVTPVWTISDMSGGSESDLTITYPATNQIAIKATNEDLIGATMVLNLASEDGNYVSSTLEIEFVEGY